MEYGLEHQTRAQRQDDFTIASMLQTSNGMDEHLGPGFCFQFSDVALPSITLLIPLFQVCGFLMKEGIKGINIAHPMC